MLEYATCFYVFVSVCKLKKFDFIKYRFLYLTQWIWQKLLKSDFMELDQMNNFFFFIFCHIWNTKDYFYQLSLTFYELYSFTKQKNAKKITFYQNLTQFKNCVIKGICSWSYLIFNVNLYEPLGKISCSHLASVPNSWAQKNSLLRLFNGSSLVTTWKSLKSMHIRENNCLFFTVQFEPESPFWRINFTGDLLITPKWHLVGSESGREVYVQEYFRSYQTSFVGLFCKKLAERFYPLTNHRWLIGSYSHLWYSSDVFINFLFVITVAIFKGLLRQAIL